MNNKNLASDLFLHKEIQTFENLISHYRFQLTDAEIERYRKLGKDAGEASESNSEILIGAGTVLDRANAEKCIEAGAKFIVSPAFDAETVKFCREKNVAIMPGTITPTEILTAWNAGADCVKIFPCDVMGGAKYLKTLKTLFPHIEMMPTGGVSLDTITDFFNAGAIAVGVGTDLVDFKAMREGNLEIIAEKARNYLEIVQNI